MADEKKPTKAQLAAGFTALSTGITAYFAGSDEIGWLGVVAAVAAGGAAYFSVYQAPNNPKKPRRKRV